MVSQHTVIKITFRPNIPSSSQHLTDYHHCLHITPPLGPPHFHATSRHTSSQRRTRRSHFRPARRRFRRRARFWHVAPDCRPAFVCALVPSAAAVPRWTRHLLTLAAATIRQRGCRRRRRSRYYFRAAATDDGDDAGQRERRAGAARWRLLKTGAGLYSCSV